MTQVITGHRDKIAALVVVQGRVGGFHVASGASFDFNKT
jgi:hypothetical protein